jgi:hypothetical protein
MTRIVHDPLSEPEYVYDSLSEDKPSFVMACKWTIEKYDGEDAVRVEKLSKSRFARFWDRLHPRENTPYEIVVGEGNLLLYGGASCLWQCLIGNGTGTAGQTTTPTPSYVWVTRRPRWLQRKLTCKETSTRRGWTLLILSTLMERLQVRRRLPSSPRMELQMATMTGTSGASLMPLRVVVCSIVKRSLVVSRPSVTLGLSL